MRGGVWEEIGAVEEGRGGEGAEEEKEEGRIKKMMMKEKQEREEEIVNDLYKLCIDSCLSNRPGRSLMVRALRPVGRTGTINNLLL